ncbi:MAG: amidohydrolase [Pseudomonadota bacterium]
MPIPNSLADRARVHAEWRRDLHQHPETAFEETRTAAFVAEKLRAFGCDAVETGIGRTGVVAVIHGRNGPGDGDKSVLLRADMDALPMREANTFEHVSKHPGAMHACGHDGHTTMLLAAAEHLAETRAFDGTAVICFQPAEEFGGGANEMIQDGLFERFPVREVYAMHTLPGLEIGRFGLRAGPMLGANEDFDLTVSGKGGHAAHPADCVDTVQAAANLVSALHGLVSREIAPERAGVLSITSIVGGDSYNVLPAEVRLKGTVRAYEAEVAAYLIERIKSVSRGVAETWRVGVDVSVLPGGYPPTINDAEKTAFARSVAAEIVGEENIREEATQLGVEDFSYMLQKRPGSYICIGNGDSAPLHHPEFDFNDAAIAPGAAFFARIVESALPLRDPA